MFGEDEDRAVCCDWKPGGGWLSRSGKRGLEQIQWSEKNRTTTPFCPFRIAGHTAMRYTDALEALPVVLVDVERRLSILTQRQGLFFSLQRECRVA